MVGGEVDVEHGVADFEWLVDIFVASATEADLGT